ncbi:MAG: DivIVA domain-containing protein [Acidimicrobiia bacterium]
MVMTPSDVEQKTFSTALRGYDLDEVDDFLDDVISTIRDLQDQIAEAKAAKPSAVPAPVEDESVIGRVLMAAQATADTVIEDARKEADQILADARSEADSWTDERDAKRAAAEEEMADLGRLVGSVRNQLAVLATEVADRLDEMDEVVGGHDTADQDLDDTEDVEEDSSEATGSHAADNDSGEEEGDDQDTEPGDDYAGDSSTTENDRQD